MDNIYNTQINRFSAVIKRLQILEDADQINDFFANFDYPLSEPPTFYVTVFMPNINKSICLESRHTDEQFQEFYKKINELIELCYMDIEGEVTRLNEALEAVYARQGELENLMNSDDV